MKRILAALALAALVAFSAPIASAISIQADLPVAASLSLKDSSGTTNVNPDPSGGIVGINFGLIGLQFESITDSKSNFQGSGGTISFEYTMLDLAINLPIPFINLAIGGGFGTGKFGGSALAGITASTANLTQLFVQLGIPFAKVFDVHVSYRVFNGTSDFGFGGPKVSETIDGSTTTLGIAFGF